MTQTGWLGALAVVLATVGGAPAQGVSKGPAGHFGHGAPREPRHHARSHPVYFSRFPGSYAFPYPGAPFGRLTFFYFPITPDGLPAYIMPSPGPVILSGDPEIDQLLLPEPRMEPPIPPGFFDPGVPVSVFRPIRPDDRLRAMQPVQPEIPPPPPREQLRPKPAAPRREAVRPPEKPLPAPPAPQAEPKKECARQLRLGRQAFAQREYALADRSFEQAAALCPEDALVHFLLAEAQFALGKYQEGAASIDAGMRLKPNWPEAFFWPRDLYELNGQDFDANLKRLADAIARFPDDRVLLFLYGYHLWFDDRRDEAQLFFRRADKLSPHPNPSERFLPPRPALPLLIW